MKAIITVVGPDRVGIIAEIATLLAKHGVNIVDISQTVMQGYFTMILMADLQDAANTFDQVQTALAEKEAETGLSIRIQREDVFRSMHRV